MMLALLILAAAAAAPPPVVPPDPPTHGGDERSWPSEAISAVHYDYQKRAKALQLELAALKRSDGGTLTPEHLALMQARLEELLSSYERDLARNDPLNSMQP
jgi:hypothetical protein